MFPNEVRLYPVTDVRLSELSHAEQVAKLGEGGANLIQLREKRLSPREFYKQAEEAMRVARKLRVQIIINDRADLAMALEADGIHLGQDDLPAETARRLLGDKAIIGVSTHNVGQALRAAELPIDYVAIGPIYDTLSKEKPDRVVGLAGLRQVRQAIGSMKLIAIGGITEENAVQVLEAGADAVAMISALLAYPGEIVTRTKHLVRTLESLR